MGALDDLTKKAQDFVEENKDTINEALNSEQAEDISDKVLDGVADAAKKVTPDEHDAKVDDVRDQHRQVDRHRALGRRVDAKGADVAAIAASAPFVVPGAGSGARAVSGRRPRGLARTARRRDRPRSPAGGTRPACSPRTA